MPHLERHQRDLDEYKANVAASAEARFGPAWWGAWDQHVHAPADGTYVDLGMGTGTFLTRLRERAPHANLIGVDLHPALIDAARAATEAARVTVVHADLATPIPLPDASADVVTSSLVFHELPHPPDLLDNAARLLKPGGTLVLFDIVKWPLSVYMQGRTLDVDTLDHFREHCLFTAEDLAWLVDHAGFDVVEVLGRTNGKFAMVFATRR